MVDVSDIIVVFTKDYQHEILPSSIMVLTQNRTGKKPWFQRPAFLNTFVWTLDEKVFIANLMQIFSINILTLLIFSSFFSILL